MNPSNCQTLRLRTLQLEMQKQIDREKQKKRKNEEQRNELQRHHSWKEPRFENAEVQRLPATASRRSFSRRDYVILIHVGNLGGLNLAKADIEQLFREKFGIVHCLVSSNKIIRFAFIIILRRDLADVLPSGCRERVVLFRGRKIKISVADNQQIHHSQLVIKQNGKEVCGFHANGSCEHDHQLRSGNCPFGRHSPPVGNQKRNRQQQRPMTAGVTQDTKIRELLEMKDGRDRESAAPIRREKRLGHAMRSVSLAAAVSSSSSEEDEEVSPPPPQEVSPARRVPLPRGRGGGLRGCIGSR